MRIVGLLLVFVACGYPRPAPFGGDDGSGQPDGSAGDPPLNLSYTKNPMYFTRLGADNDHPSVGGGPVMTWSVDPPLPTGLSLDPGTGVISGTPQDGAPLADYTVTAANENGMTSVDLKLRVNDVTAIATGSFHSCAITAGSIVCWGQNQMGQVGNGMSGPDVPLATDVAGTTGATSICAGDGHTCAVINGIVKCWGSNQYGQLGTGTVGGMATTPQSVVGGLPAGASAVTCGQYHTCALINGLTFCWGKNDFGQLGDGNTSNPIASPQEVAIATASAIASEPSGRTTCAIVNNGAELDCWGDGGNGQIVFGQGGNYPTPRPISGFPPPGETVQSVAPSAGNICGISQARPFCWGSNNHGESGQPIGQPVNNPTALPGITTGARTVAAGHQHMCMVLVSGAVCWGFNLQGQLGNGSQVDNDVPQSNQLLHNVAQVAAGANESCAVDDGHVYCWGDGMFGHLGNGVSADSDYPVPVTGL